MGRRRSVGAVNSKPAASPPAAVRAVTNVVQAIPGPIKAALVFLAGMVGALGAVTFRSRRRLSKAEHRALTDGLTGLGNHGSVQENLRRMVAAAHRMSTPLAAVLIDLDYFKAINDTYGHAKGDEVLQRVAGAIRESFRASDFTGRFGGEEFIALLPDTDRHGAKVAAEHFAGRLAATTVPGLQRPVTASVGIAVMPTDAATPDELLENADRALYRAKAGGRDRIELAPSRYPAWPDPAILRGMPHPPELVTASPHR